MPPQHTLLTEPVLQLQQVSTLMSNNFDILNQQGEVVGIIVTSGSSLSRIFMGSRTLQVTEADGRPVVEIEDTVNFGRDTFELTDPDGHSLAHLRKRFTLFKQRVDMQLADGTTVEMHGGVLDFNFDFRIGQFVPALVTREWSGMGNALLGRSTYSVSFAADAPPHLRAVIIGGVIALDLIRAKQSSD